MARYKPCQCCGGESSFKMIHPNGRSAHVCVEHYFELLRKKPPELRFLVAPPEQLEAEPECYLSAEAARACGMVPTPFARRPVTDDPRET